MSDFEYQIGSFSGKKREYYCEVVGNIDIIDNHFIHFFGLPKFTNSELENDNLETMVQATNAFESGIIFKLNLENGSFNKEILRKAIDNNLPSIIFIKNSFSNLNDKDYKFINLLTKKDDVIANKLLIYSDNNDEFIKELSDFSVNLSLPPEQNLSSEIKEKEIPSFTNEDEIFLNGNTLLNNALKIPSKEATNNLFNHYFSYYKNYAYKFYEELNDKKEEINLIDHFYDSDVKCYINNRRNLAFSKNFDVPNVPVEIIEALLYEGETVEDFRKKNTPYKVTANFYNINYHHYNKARNYCETTYEDWESYDKQTQKQLIAERLEETDHNLSSKDFFYLYNNLFNKQNVITKMKKTLENLDDNKYAVWIDEPEFHGIVALQVLEDETKTPQKEIIINTAYKIKDTIQDRLDSSKLHIDITDDVYNKTITGVVNNNFKNESYDFHKKLFNYYFAEYCNTVENWKYILKHKYSERINIKE